MIQFTDINGDTVYIRREAVDEVRTLSTAGHSHIVLHNGNATTVLGTPDEVASKLTAPVAPGPVKAYVTKRGDVAVCIYPGEWHTGYCFNEALKLAAKATLKVEWLKEEEGA